MKISLSYPDSEFHVPDRNLVGIFEPKETYNNEDETIRTALANPIGCKRIKDTVSPNDKVLILVDDNTRNTPTELILKPLFEELLPCISDASQVCFLLAGGTHRPMTDEEKVRKLGRDVFTRFKVYEHNYKNEDSLRSTGAYFHGTEVKVNKLLMEYDYLIAIGHIVPHVVCGFGGGAKMIQPGVCGKDITGKVHWESTLVYKDKNLIGKRENSIRKCIDEIGAKVGLDFIINVILDINGRIAHCVTGDFINAHKKGCEYSKAINGFKISEKVDAVICDSYPCDIDFWQASKAVLCSEVALKKNGICILRSPCPEGVSAAHKRILDYGYKPIAEVKSLIDNGTIKDLSLAAHIGIMGETLKNIELWIVSEGITQEEAFKLNIRYSYRIQEVIDNILTKDKDAKFLVLKHASELFPIITKQ